MPRRLRLYDFRVSEGPADLGLCGADIIRVGQIASAAERRLIMASESSDEGWLGTFAEVAFQISQTSPYLTTPRNIARIESVNLCNRVIPVKSQFFEYLEFGNGRMPKTRPSCGPSFRAAYTRNNVPTFVDLTNPPQFIAVYATNPVDVQAAKRVLLQGIDANGNVIRSQDGPVQVNGQFVALESPFAVSPMTFSSITGIQKDVTQSDVQFFQVDPTTGAQTLLLTMEPGEQVASYRRYFFNNLPFDCCGTATAPATITITALCKLDPIPLVSDADYFLLTSLEAIIEEAQCIRYRRMDDAVSKSMAADHHKNAIRLLNGEVNHYLGQDSVAVNFKPFGSARLSKLHLGMT